MKKENKPCPFCGSKSLRVSAPFPYFICCTHCEGDGPVGNTPEEAWEKWNDRKEKEEND